jgi:hypothetical protein
MNRYEIALQVLEKLSPELPSTRERREKVPAAPLQTHHLLANVGLRIQEYIEAILPLPEMTILLGRCEDGLPLLMDLDDPSSGAMLINSRSKDQARYLLKSILTSAKLINPSNQVQYTLISSKPETFGNLIFQPHCHRKCHPNHRDAGQHILDISALVEQRYSGRRRGPALLLAIDDLEAFERGSLDEEAFSHLQWIIHEGPSVGVWPIVTADIQIRGSFEDQMIRQFGTEIFDSNHYDSSHAFTHAGGDGSIRQPSFEVSIGGEALRFNVPIL